MDQILSKMNIDGGLQNHIKSQKPKHDTYEYIHYYTHTTNIIFLNYDYSVSFAQLKGFDLIPFKPLLQKYWSDRLRLNWDYYYLIFFSLFLDPS